METTVYTQPLQLVGKLNNTTYKPGFVILLSFLVFILIGTLGVLITIAVTVFNPNWVKKMRESSSIGAITTRQLQLVPPAIVYSNAVASEHQTVVATVVYEPHTGTVQASVWCKDHIVVLGLQGKYFMGDSHVVLESAASDQPSINIWFDLLRNKTTMSVEGIVDLIVLHERSPQSLLRMVYISISVNNLPTTNIFDVKTIPDHRHLSFVPTMPRNRDSAMIGSYAFALVQGQTQINMARMVKESAVVLLDLDSRCWWVRIGQDMPFAHISSPWSISLQSPDQLGDWCCASFYMCRDGGHPAYFQTESCPEALRMEVHLLYNPIIGAVSMNITQSGSTKMEFTLMPISLALLIPLLLSE
jgi:hypothetical protein